LFDFTKKQEHEVKEDHPQIMERVVVLNCFFFEIASQQQKELPKWRKLENQKVDEFVIFPVNYNKCHEKKVYVIINFGNIGKIKKSWRISVDRFFPFLFDF